MKNFFLALPAFLILGLIVIVNLFRFAFLDKVPQGFHVDELCSAVTIQCLATEGVDARNHPFPLYSELNFGNPKPPTFIYPGILWGKAFGFSVPSFRAYSATANLLGIVGLFFLGRLLFGPRYGLLTALLATISPWPWTFSRIGMESISGPTFLIWGLFFFLSKNRWHNLVLSGILLAAAMYTYPATRLHVPLMLITLVIYRWRKKELNLKNLTIFLTTLALFLFPLAQKILGGQLLDRFNDVSILNSDYLASVGKTRSLGDLSLLFLQNYAKHFQADFWLWNGDVNPVYSTRAFGVLSWLDMLGLALGLVMLGGLAIKKFQANNPWIEQRKFLLFLLINILLGIVPVGLTHNGLPHSLRIIGSWPFVMLLCGFFLWKVAEKRKAVLGIYFLVAAIFITSFLKFYFVSYPPRTKGMFLYWAQEEAQRAKTNEDWMNFMFHYRYQDFTLRYYLMNNRGETCTTALRNWEMIRKLAPILESKQQK